MKMEKRHFRTPAAYSGSAIIDDDNKMVGLLWGGDADLNSVDLTWANNIDKVIAALITSGHAITIAVSPPGQERRATQRKTSSSIQSNQPSLTKRQQHGS